MAKGNLFQGMARGKVGDVVFSRANGEQISRVRNRHPKNPRSNAQLFQRAIMATIVQAYSSGKAIFDHSFQGYAVGAQNQRKFISENAKLLREAIAADINTQIATNQQKGRVVAPSVSQPVPFGYVISKGNYPQNLLVSPKNGTYNFPNAQENEKVKDYASRFGLIAGDIYTIVIFAPQKTEAFTTPLYDDVLSMQKYCNFAYIRFTVKSGLATSEDVLTKIGQVFEIEQPGTVLLYPADIANMEIGGDLSISTLLVDSAKYTGTGAIGVIRSRKDEDLRSDSIMQIDYGTTAEDMFGIASDYLLDVWKAGTSSIGDSDLILEGGGL